MANFERPISVLSRISKKTFTGRYQIGKHRGRFSPPLIQCGYQPIGTIHGMEDPVSVLWSIEHNWVLQKKKERKLTNQNALRPSAR